MSGELRPLPGLVASASKKSPRIFIIFLVFSILGFGLIDRSPWRGTDLYGVALVKNCIDAFHGFSTSCIVPNLYGSVITSDGPLFTWIASFIVLVCEFLYTKVLNLNFSFTFIDDLGRIIQSFFALFGLTILWLATKNLALKRESKPNDPLGIGPTSDKFSSNIADCSVLVTISCLGLIMPWHELGKTGLNFMLHSLVFFAIVIAPETPRKAGVLFGISSSLLMLCSGVGSFIAVYFAGFVIFFTCYPWTLVRKIFLLHSIALSIIIFFSMTFLDVNYRSENLIQIWWQNQLTLDKPQPLFLIKTWLWTWWPLWPIVTAFSIQAYNKGFLSLPHLKMPLTLLICLIAMPLSGTFVTDGVKFVPVVPLAVLASFGLLSLPRNIANLIDYFALTIFTFLGLMIWMYWLALHTGTPEFIQSNVLRAAPGVSGIYSAKELILGIIATFAWLMLIGWRIRVSEPLLWRPVILSAGGIGMTWILLVNLWGPALEVNRGYGELTNQIENTVNKNNPKKLDFCVGIDVSDFKSRAIILANSNLKINQSSEEKALECNFFLVRQTKTSIHENLNNNLDERKWNLAWSGNRKADPRKKETFYLFKRN